MHITSFLEPDITAVFKTNLEESQVVTWISTIGDQSFLIMSSFLVHLVVSIPPRYVVSQFMGFLKGKLALQLFDRFPQLRKKYWGQHVWSRGYCVSTVGLDEERIKKYVKWQRSKDKDADVTQGKLFNYISTMHLPGAIIQATTFGGGH